MLLGILRGCFIAEGYWEWKSLVSNSFDLSLPIFVYVFSIPEILRRTLRLWIKVAIPAFIVYYGWTMESGIYQNYLGPVLVLFCFLPVLSKKWKFIFVTLLLLMIFSDFGARSQVIKATVVLLIGIGYALQRNNTLRYISLPIMRFMYWTFYFGAITLLYLGITDQFNLFEKLAENEGSTLNLM